MDAEEIRLRALYLFLSCARAVEQFTERLGATFPASPLSARLTLERSLRKELGLLFRYWATRQIWDRLDAREAEATQLNLSLLRLFTDGFKLPKDGSGLRYAELSTTSEEARELSQRVTHALGMAHEPLVAELQTSIVPWRDAVSQYTTEALELPLEQISAVVKTWAQRSETAK